MRYTLALSGVMGLFCAVSFAVERPNVLLITADDLGMQLSCYGDPIAKTPHLDRLAARSVQFETAYVSQASCSPSRATMLTGLYPHGNGQYGLANARTNFRVHDHLIDHLLPNVLKRAGYRTGIIGKLHVEPAKRFAFDMRSSEGFESRDVRKQVERAREFMASAEGTPWFLMFNLFDPHTARDRLEGDRMGPSYFPNEVKGLPSKVLTADDVSPWPWQAIDSPKQRARIAGYYNCVHRADAAIGLLMEALEKAKGGEETLIIFLGDHGAPFTRGKTSCYEAGLRVPFLLCWPGLSEAHVSRRLVSSVDIYPTVLDAAGIEPPGGLHGRSLRPILTPANSANWRNTMIAEFNFHNQSYFFPRRAITDGRYKLIHNLLAGQAKARPTVGGDDPGTLARALSETHSRTDDARGVMNRKVDPPKWELYDLETDPVEFHNKAGEAALREVESRLRAELANWQEATGDRFGDPEFRRKIANEHE